MAKTKVLICPYCGDTQPVAETCRACGGLFEPLSRQATHNEMGPWYVRDLNRPFQPGCSYETLIKLIERNQISRFSILRGPTTKQFWTIAKRVPGVSHLLGYCHNCDASVDVGDHGCHACGVPFGAYLDRNYLGLPEVRPLPWDAPHDDDNRMAGAVESASARTMDFRRAAEPLGISSFASDDELRRDGSYGAPAHAAPYSHSAPMAAGASYSASSAAPHSMPPMIERGELSATSLEDLPATIAARAAQRRVEEQRRTIRLLMLGLLAAVIVAAAAAMYSFVIPRLNVAPGRSAEQVNPPPAAISGSQPLEDSLDVDHEATRGADQPDLAPETIPADGARVNPILPPIDIAVEYERAQNLIAMGEQADRPLQERIADYEAALQILKTIEERTVPEQAPDGLADRIKNAQRALDELRLKVFFP